MSGGQLSGGRLSGGRLSGGLMSVHPWWGQYKWRSITNEHLLDLSQNESSVNACLGAVQRIFFQKSEITMEVGGWVQVSL